MRFMYTLQAGGKGEGWGPGGEIHGMHIVFVIYHESCSNLYNNNDNVIVGVLDEGMNED